MCKYVQILQYCHVSLLNKHSKNISLEVAYLWNFIAEICRLKVLNPISLDLF